MAFSGHCPSVVDSPSAVRWISTSQAARILGKGPEAVRRVLDLAGVTRQDLPGCRPRWLLDDVRGLAERSVRRPEPLTERHSDSSAAVPALNTDERTARS